MRAGHCLSLCGDCYCMWHATSRGCELRVCVLMKSVVRTFIGFGVYIYIRIREGSDMRTSFPPWCVLVRVYAFDWKSLWCLGGISGARLRNNSLYKWESVGTEYVTDCPSLYLNILINIYRYFGKNNAYQTTFIWTITLKRSYIRVSMYIVQIVLIYGFM